MGRGKGGGRWAAGGGDPSIERHVQTPVMMGSSSPAVHVEGSE